MYNGIGLATPRGSATNGYVQRNLSFVREGPRQQYNYQYERQKQPSVQKQPNNDILEHERKRQIEIKVMEWAQSVGILDDETMDEVEREALMQQKREEFAKMNIEKEIDREKFRKLQESHQRNLQKQKEMKIFKDAVGIDDGYIEGSAFDFELQEKKKQERMMQRIERELEEEERRRMRAEEERDRAR
jgi:serine/arginine repetitive matrix protein 2